MSLFTPMTVTCPHCQTGQAADAVGSVNADRRPDLRQAILDNSFQVINCVSCEVDFRLEPQFNYLDVDHSHWIAVYPARRMPDYLEVEDEAMDAFNDSYGTEAIPAAKAIGDDLEVRVVFGWPAIREKLALREAGLDDQVIELLKLDLLRRLPEAPLSPGVELRWVGISDDQMSFVWISAETEEVLQELGVNRMLYDDIVENAESWAPLRADVSEGPFVDMQRLYMGEGRAAAE